MKIREQLRLALQQRRYSPRTEEVYVDWLTRYIRFHGLTHPSEVGPRGIESFLQYLAHDKDCSGSTIGQALSALVFFYRHVLHVDPGKLSAIPRPKRARPLPVVLTPDEMQSLLRELSGKYLLIVQLLYGSALRINECLELRVKDCDLNRRAIAIRAAKGNRDRMTVLPRSLVHKLGKQVESIAELHAKDVRRGAGYVRTPHAFSRKSTTARRDLNWQYLFPASRLTFSEDMGCSIRSHLHDSAVGREIKAAAARAHIHKRVTCHTARHSSATHMLQRGVDIRTIQVLLGHKSVKTTMIYTHVAKQGPLGVISPLDHIMDDEYK